MTQPGWALRVQVEQVMGIPISLHLRAPHPDRRELTVAVAAMWDRLREADRVFSTWRADSDVMRLRTGTLSPDQAHPWVSQVRALCERASAVTGGLFSTDLVGPDGTRGWDPTGLVKGWAVQTAAASLRAVPAVCFSLNAGGDLVCGSGPDSADIDQVWRIGIEDPHATSTLTHVIPVRDGALATSGTAWRGGHIVDPRTGLPMRTTRTSITVTGPDLTWCDTWATVSFVDPAALGRAGAQWSDYRVAAVTH